MLTSEEGQSRLRTLLSTILNMTQPAEMTPPPPIKTDIRPCNACRRNFDSCRLAGDAINRAHDQAHRIFGRSDFLPAPEVIAYGIHTRALSVVETQRLALSDPNSADPKGTLYSYYAMAATHPDRLQRIINEGWSDCLQLDSARNVYSYLSEKTTQQQLQPIVDET